MVRQAACPAAARGAGAEAPGLLLTAYRRDPSVPVRLAAAGALFELEAPGRGVLDALVQGLADPEPAVRDLCAARLPELDPQRVVPAVVAALEGEARRPELDGPALARLFLVLQRSSRRDVRYVPGMSRAEVRSLLDGVHQWADRGGAVDARPRIWKARIGRWPRSSPCWRARSRPASRSAPATTARSSPCLRATRRGHDGRARRRRALRPRDVRTRGGGRQVPAREPERPRGGGCRPARVRGGRGASAGA